jgi:transposase
MARREALTNAQWTLITPLLPEPPRRTDGRGRPWRDAREVLNGILWILRSGARWQDLPERFPPYQPCHRRFHQWVRDGTLRRALEVLAAALRERGALDLRDCFIDGPFVVAQTGASAGERPSGARVRSSWRWQTALVFFSPSTRRLRRRLKSPSSRTLSLKPLSPRFLHGESGIRPTTVIPSRRSWPPGASRCSPLTVPRGSNPPPRMGAPGAVSVGGGRGSAGSPGYRISGGWWCATSIRPSTSSALGAWAVS